MTKAGKKFKLQKTCFYTFCDISDQLKQFFLVCRKCIGLSALRNGATGTCNFWLSNRFPQSMYVIRCNFLFLEMFFFCILASPLDDGETCIYGYGAIRFLSSSNNQSIKYDKNIISRQTLVHRFVKHGLIQLITLHLQILNEYGCNQKLCGQPLHVLFQVSGALRSIAGKKLKMINVITYYLMSIKN